jgi:phage baseplate assembly protein W
MRRGMDTAFGFKGTGWAFPPAFSAGGGEVEMVGGDDDIHQSLEILLATVPGERLMQPDFGCDLDAFVFEAADQSLITRITRMVSDAVLYHEPRVDLRDVNIAPDPVEAGRIIIRVDYRSRLTNTRYNMVYPFYLREAVVGAGAPAGPGG